MKNVCETEEGLRAMSGEASQMWGGREQPLQAENRVLESTVVEEKHSTPWDQQRAWRAWAHSSLLEVAEINLEVWLCMLH